MKRIVQSHPPSNLGNWDCGRAKQPLGNLGTQGRDPTLRWHPDETQKQPMNRGRTQAADRLELGRLNVLIQMQSHVFLKPLKLERQRRCTGATLGDGPPEFFNQQPSQIACSPFERCGRP